MVSITNVKIIFATMKYEVRSKDGDFYGRFEKLSDAAAYQREYAPNADIFDTEIERMNAHQMNALIKECEFWELYIKKNNILID